MTTFLILSLVLFAKSAVAASVSAESGVLRSLDGVWAFPDCVVFPDPTDPPDPGEFDSQEYLIFNGNSVENREVVFNSANGTCSGGVMDVESETYIFSTGGEVVSPGWAEFEEDEFGNEILVPVPPPDRQDGSGPLDATPLVTILTFLIPGEPDESGYSYIDDTGQFWYLYGEAGEDDAPTEFMSPDEPLIKVDSAVGVIPVPASIWLFGSALIGFVGISRKRKLS